MNRSNNYTGSPASTPIETTPSSSVGERCLIKPTEVYPRLFPPRWREQQQTGRYLVVRLKRCNTKSLDDDFAERDTSEPDGGHYRGQRLYRARASVGCSRARRACGDHQSCHL